MLMRADGGTERATFGVISEEHRHLFTTPRKCFFAQCVAADLNPEEVLPASSVNVCRMQRTDKTTNVGKFLN